MTVKVHRAVALMLGITWFLGQVRNKILFPFLILKPNTMRLEVLAHNYFG